MSRTKPTREERMAWQLLQQDFEAFPDERLAKLRAFLEEDPGFLGREVGLQLVNALDYARYSRNTFIKDVCRADERARIANAKVAELEKVLEQAIERARLVSEDSQTDADIRAYNSEYEVSHRLIVWNSRLDYAELNAYLKAKEVTQP